MPRYLLYAGDQYYPSSGIGDLLFGKAVEAESLDAAREMILSRRLVADWYTIVELDIETFELTTVESASLKPPPDIYL